MRQILYKFFKDKNLRNLLSIFIAAYKEDGIPIGWLTSEIFANIYLHEMDMYITKNFPNVKYKRFMDDFIIISTNKEELVECIKSVGKFLNINLLLIENPKSKIYKNHVDFCGYVIFAGYKKCRQRIFYSAFRRYKKYIMYGEFEKLFQSIPSLFGYAKFCMCRTKLVNLIYRLFSNLYIIPHTTKEEYYIKFLKDIKVKITIITSTNSYLNKIDIPNNVNIIHNDNIHGRYIFIDDKYVYALDNSFNNIGKKEFIIMKLENITKEMILLERK